MRCRLSWPEGTVIFEVATTDAHIFAHRALKEAGAKVRRGSLLRRVAFDIEVRRSLFIDLVNLQKLSAVDLPQSAVLSVPVGQESNEDLVDLLQAAGYRANRLSVWILQVGQISIEVVSSLPTCGLPIYSHKAFKMSSLTT